MGEMKASPRPGRASPGDVVSALQSETKASPHPDRVSQGNLQTGGTPPLSRPNETGGDNGRAAGSTSPPVVRPDAATFEVVKNSLYAVAEEMKVVLAKTAYSPILKVAGDYSCGVFDARRDMVAQGPDLPIHLGSMPDAVKAVIQAWAHDIGPGDTFIHNDPYFGGSHLPDVNVVAPAFVGDDDTLLGFCCVRAHWPDIGSATPGSLSYETVKGGSGARPDRDGINAVASGISNTMNTPVEIIEMSFPVRVESYELRPDSGGAGRFRGGLGARRTWRVLERGTRATVCCERTKSAPFGVAGGEDSHALPHEHRGSDRGSRLAHPGEPRVAAHRPGLDAARGVNRTLRARYHPALRRGQDDRPAAHRDHRQQRTPR